MPPTHRPAPPERPDPAVLLIDAVINRQQHLAQRLGQQWIHRHGLKAFATLSTTKVLPTCGDDGLQWLQDQLGLHRAVDGDAGSAQPQALPLGSLIREALREALQPLRQESADEGMATRPPLTAADPWQLPPVSPVPFAAPSAGAAPAPADLAGLRAWLHSDAA